jgi:hypothetical protein
VVHRKDSRTIDYIFWYPVNPIYKDWQRKCQVWLLKRGYQRPPMSAQLRKLREDFNEPTDPAKIPLPDISTLEQEITP